MLVRLKESGSIVQEAQSSDTENMIERRAMLVYAGTFESMDGEVVVTPAHLQALVKSHNSVLGRVKRLASGETPLKNFPPVQADHSTSAWDTIGRVVGELELGDHEEEEGKPVPAVFGTVRFLGKENVERVKDGRWTHLSIGADFDKSKLAELTVTPFPAAKGASLLKASRLANIQVGDKVQIMSGPDKNKVAKVQKIDREGWVTLVSTDGQSNEYHCHLDDLDKLSGHSDATVRFGARLSSKVTTFQFPDGQWGYAIDGLKANFKFDSEKKAKQEGLDDAKHSETHMSEGNNNKDEPNKDAGMKRLGLVNSKVVGDKMVFVYKEGAKFEVSVGDDDGEWGSSKTFGSEGEAMSAGKAAVSSGEYKKWSRLAAADGGRTRLSEGGGKDAGDDGKKDRLKKYLMDCKKMSEEDADKELDKLSAEDKKEDLDKLSAEEDEYTTKMSADAAEKEKSDKESKLNAAKAEITRLSTDFRASTDNARLAATKGRIITRLSKLRSSAKITPAEIKKIDVTKLAASSPEAIDAVLATYENREPVIMVGQFGSLKADDISKFQSKVRITRLEAETRANMPLLARLDKAKRLADGGGEGEVEGKPVNVVHVQPEGGAAADLSQYEADYGHICMMIDQGNGVGAKDALKQLLTKMASSAASADVTESNTLETENQLSSLAESVQKMQTQFDSLSKLASSLVG